MGLVERNNDERPSRLPLNAIQQIVWVYELSEVLSCIFHPLPIFRNPRVKFLRFLGEPEVISLLNAFHELRNIVILAGMGKVTGTYHIGQLGHLIVKTFAIVIRALV